jgi:hypothetical protein
VAQAIDRACTKQLATAVWRGGHLIIRLLRSTADEAERPVAHCPQAARAAAGCLEIFSAVAAQTSESPRITLCARGRFAPRGSAPASGCATHHGAINFYIKDIQSYSE